MCRISTRIPNLLLLKAFIRLFFKFDMKKHHYVQFQTLTVCLLRIMYVSGIDSMVRLSRVITKISRERCVRCR